LEHGETAVLVHIQAQNVALVIAALASGRGCGCSRGVMSDCFDPHFPARVPVAARPRKPSWHLTGFSVTAPKADHRRLPTHRQVPRTLRLSLSLGSFGDARVSRHDLD
jgi:hypothetical protein